MHQNEWFQVWFFKNFLGRGSPSPLPRPLPPLLPSHQIITNDFSWKWQLNHFLVISNNCLKYAPKWMVSSLIFQKFSGEGLTEPPPQTPPPAFSRASPSVRASPSILGRFAPSTRASPSILGRFAPSIRASPSTFDWGPWCGPPKINSWIRPCVNHLLHFVAYYSEWCRVARVDLYYYITLFLSVADPGGATGGHGPPKRWSNFFSHLVIPITDRFFE